MDMPRLDDVNEDGIAIVGMSGRFPGAQSVDELWQNLLDGVESIDRLSDEELRRAGVSEDDLRDPLYVKAAPRIEAADMFDPSYFGYSRREAELIDPQHRIFLECAVHALEDSGHDPDTYGGQIGVFGGAATNVYQATIQGGIQRELDSSPTLRLMFATGNDKDYLGTRVSYKLNLRGPSLTVQSACSTSLVAVHLACQSLLLGECDLALAGGVCIARSYSAQGYTYVEGGIRSPDGHCRPFDVKAKGTVFGDGVGIVVLKRYRDAIADGDNVRAVIRASAFNNDGSGKTGFTAPSEDGQAHVVQRALGLAGLSASEIGMVEAHGTGTELGDPIEIAGLTQAFRQSTNETQYCALGSIKGNIGHLDTAAGVASLIKTALAVESGKIPASINCSSVNPLINIENTPFYVNTDTCDWPKRGGTRYAAVSAFGVGGTNVHMILEECRAVGGQPSRRKCHPVLLSARNMDELNRLTESTCGRLASLPDASLADVAATLAAGRTLHKVRRGVVADTMAAAIDRLKQTLAEPEDLELSAKRDLVYMFPGQGSQRVGMGRDLYREEAVYRSALDHCAQLFKQELDIDIRDYLLAEVEDGPSAQDLVRTDIAQPAIFSTSWAMAQLLQSWGIKPDAMIGHSVGEWVAAALGEVVSIDDAISIVAHRGTFMQGMAPGSMAAVNAEESTLQPFIGNGISIAAINGRESCVISGPSAEMTSVLGRLEHADLYSVPLKTSHAFHSTMMDVAANNLETFVKGIRLGRTKIPFVSNSTGDWITEGQTTSAKYWADHVRNPVRFYQGVSTLAVGRQIICLEVGGGRTLSSFVAGRKEGTCRAYPSFVPGSGDEVYQVLEGVEALWKHGVPLAWQAIYGNERRHKVRLPAYPFSRQRYWSGTSKPSVTDEIEIHRLGWKKIWNHDSNPSREPSNILVLAKDGRLGDRLAKSLSARCANHVRRWSFDDAGFEGMLEEVANFLGSRHERCKIVYMPGEPGLDAESEAVKWGFFRFVRLIKMLILSSGKAKVDLTFLMFGAEAVFSGDQITPAWSLARGPALSVPEEHDNIRCTLLDVDHIDRNEEDIFSDELCNAILSSSLGVRCALRKNTLWSPFADRSRELTTAAGIAKFRTGGRYLITGGLGDLALAIAEAISVHGRCSLVLLGRSPLTSDDQAAGSFGEGASARGAHVRQQIDNIKFRGTEVVIVTADVGDATSLSNGLKQAGIDLGSINGIIHAAGIRSRDLTIDKADEQMASVLWPKVSGLSALDSVFQGCHVEFLVLFSSISSVNGYPGLADYSAANAFLDAYAQAGGHKWVENVTSINWDLWSEIGMGVNAPMGQGASKLRVQGGLRTREGIEALFKALGSNERQLAVARQSTKLYAPDVEADTPTRTSYRVEKHGHDEPSNVQASERGHSEPESALQKSLCSIWGAVLDHAGVGIDDNFFDLGGHSLLALQLVAQLRKSLNVKVSARDIFISPTVRQLAIELEARENQAVALA